MLYTLILKNMKSKYKDYIFYLVSSVIAVAGYIIISSYLNAMREVVKIENIKKGELIYSYNLLTGEIELKPVLEVLKTYNQGNTLKLKFTENIEIETKSQMIQFILIITQIIHKI